MKPFKFSAPKSPVLTLSPELRDFSSAKNWLADFLINAFPRGVAMFLGGFTLLNLLGEVRLPGFDANLWWIDMRAFPQTLANGFLFLSAAGLIAYAVRSPRSLWRRILTLGCVAVLIIVSLVETVVFYRLLLQKAIHAGIPVPLSLVIGAALGLILASLVPGSRFRNESNHFLPTVAVCFACVLAFPLGQIFCFGKTDYRRPADVAVVLGARVYSDGRPSDALADRVRTACGLYRDGLARKLLFSGGPGEGAIHETESMKRLALKLGVKESDILCDVTGLNTQATVRNTEAMFARLHASRVLVVSHFYHLPRIKLAYQRAGWDVYTVPAKESYLLRQMPYNIAREVAALWVYYLRPLA